MQRQHFPVEVSSYIVSEIASVGRADYNSYWSRPDSAKHCDRIYSRPIVFKYTHDVMPVVLSCWTVFVELYQYHNILRYLRCCVCYAVLLFACQMPTGTELPSIKRHNNGDDTKQGDASSHSFWKRKTWFGYPTTKTVEEADKQKRTERIEGPRLRRTRQECKRGGKSHT